jgi:hypothetical protein
VHRVFFALLHVATVEDIENVRIEFGAKPPRPLPDRIERDGRVYDLTKEIYRFLAYLSPDKVDMADIDKMIQGPFCPKCGSLKTTDCISSYHDPQFRDGAFVLKHCPKCEAHEGTKESIGPLLLVKKRVYMDLDAEMRSTRELALVR